MLPSQVNQALPVLGIVIHTQTEEEVRWEATVSEEMYSKNRAVNPEPSLTCLFLKISGNVKRNY